MIKLDNLTKVFNQTTVVQKLSLEVQAGQILGFLGRNGAGKTTTMRMLATILQPTSGTALIAGFDLLKDPKKIRASIGIVNGGMKLPEKLTVAEALEYHGILHALSDKQIKNRSKDLFEKLEINYGQKLCRELSTGMAQRAIIARALLSQPKVLLLDEACNGLDIPSREEVKNIVREYAAQGNSVIYSTHVLEELNGLADHTAIIEGGVLVETKQGFNLLNSTHSLSKTGLLV
jgi:sodium transport system ATP-binding protein